MALKQTKKYNCELPVIKHKAECHQENKLNILYKNGIKILRNPYFQLQQQKDFEFGSNANKIIDSTDLKKYNFDGIISLDYSRSKESIIKHIF